MPGLEGKTLGRYEIVDLLGAGGMGEVYRAKDTQLGRPVAIKVISGKVAQNRRTIERFEREAKTVAQLSHPNILDIHDFGSDDGVVYAVTELLEGNDLRDRMRGSMLPLSKAVEIGVAVANGLAAAHSKAIVHRDIKPENVFVTSTGQVKILDFGIAALREDKAPEPGDSSARTESLTSAGNVVGTVGYMSPEQVRGEKVDSRSDIFALGSLLYEVLTGHRAFQGDTSHDTAMAILNRDPDPITTHRQDVPPGLEVIIRRCLEKQPDERFESARDVAFALQAISGARPPIVQPRPEKTILGIPQSKIASVVAVALVVVAAITWIVMTASRVAPPLPERLRLAVVPFEATDAQDELGLFAAGLTEIITEQLALLEELEDGIEWVIPRHILSESGSQGVDEIHRQFNNTVTIKGHLQRARPNIRLTIDAIEPKSNTRLQRSTIEDLPGNVDAMQQTPLLRIAQMIGIEVDSETREHLAASSTTVTGAWDVYVRGRGLLATADESSEIEAAIDLVAEAVRQDPLFTGAQIALGRASLSMFEASNDDQWLDRGLEHARRASGLEGRADEAWRVMAALHHAAGRPEAALAALRTAVRLQPGNAEAFFDLGLIHQKLKQFDESEEAFERALYLRPGYWPGHDALAKLYLSQGRYEPAAIQFRHVVDCAPDFAIGYVKLAGTNIYLGQTKTATELLEKSIDIEPSYGAYSNLGLLYFEASRFADAAAMYELALEEDRDNYMTWGFLAYSFMYGDQTDRAKETFRRAVELAEAGLLRAPDDLWIRTDLADYYAMLGERERGLSLLETVAEAIPDDPQLVGWIAEAFEDLDEREKALEWVAKSFDAGLTPSRFEGRPTLRDLVADERYRALVDLHTGGS